MNQKLLFLTITLIAFLAIGGVFWLMQKRQVVMNQPVTTDVTEALKFVTDVDPDVNHWQTKETEFFTIKFPKEWYWLESDLEKTGYHSRVITNNSDFDIDRYADISIFSDIGPRSPINLIDAEILITDRGVPTSNAGTPSDALDSIFELAKRNYPAVDCIPPNDLKTLPIIARCTAHYPEDQTQLSYYVIDNNWAFTITARMRGENESLRPIVEKIARSIRIKY